MGKPNSLSPDGTTTVGKPLEVQGTWKAASPVVLRSLGAGETVAGVMVVFDDGLAAAHFLRVARQEMERSGVEVPLCVSH